MKTFTFRAGMGGSLVGREVAELDLAMSAGEGIKAIFRAYEYLVAKLDGGWLVSCGDGYPIAVCASAEEAMSKVSELVAACEKADALMEKAAKAAGAGYREAIDALSLEGDAGIVGRLKKAKLSEVTEKQERERFTASLAEREFEVLSEGTWNKRKFTLGDLTTIVDNTKARLSYLKPTLKIGHDDEQALAKSAGLPAMGWMKDIRLEGTKVIATFAGIPEGLNKLLGKAWKRVSCELLFGWRDPETGDKLTVMSAVALLGEELPAVTNLADIAALYGEEWTAAQESLEAMRGGIYAAYREDPCAERVLFTYPKEDHVEKPEDKKTETVSKEAFAALLETAKGLEAQIAEGKARETERVKLSAEEKIDAALSVAVTEARIVPAQVEALKKLCLKASDEHVRLSMSAKPGEKVESTLDMVLAEIKSRPAMKGIYRELGRSTDEPAGETLTEAQACEMAEKMEKAEKISYQEAWGRVRSAHTIKKSTSEAPAEAGE